MRGQHPGQMRGMTGTGNDHLKPSLPGGTGVFRGSLGTAVGGRHGHFNGNTKFFEYPQGAFHHLQIRIAAP